ncbi:hypothetical protein GCK72_008132 [Caenorhabditis remanei]|uniref:Uncharacterized protein n=3 Tax=Caenorhabditis TaxID=6237 RepID=E3MDG9_CAERE|nr:hypothetical protein GCK72_008132 [Caenorhabditis remanei]EFO99127.1 hypothetical protein CRE_17907 [Caenorhabditis remanei]KAF1768170.1 hypothetical protein GCK72_008132 [Caenorhabditis remanei]
MVRKSHCGYGFFLIIGFLLTLVAIFTPGWRSYKDKETYDDIFLWDHVILGNGAPDLGLISRYCGQGVREVNQYDCKSYGRFQLPFEKTTLAFMIIAIIFEVVSIGCFIGLFSPRARLGMPAFSVTGLAFFSLFVAIVVYGVRMQYKILYLQSTSYELLANVYLGYSYWIAVIAAICMLIASSLSGTLIGPAENTDHLH